MSLCPACREHRHNGVDEDYDTPSAAELRTMPF
jgi:hypothetical protein